MKNSVILGTTAVVLLLGAAGGSGYFYMQNQLHHRLDAGIHMLEKTFPGASVTYEHSKIDVFSRSAILENVKIKGQSGQLYTIGQLDVKSGSQNELMSVSADNLDAPMSSGLTPHDEYVHIDHIDIYNFKPNKDLLDIDSTGKIEKIYFSKLNFDVLNLDKVSVKSLDEDVYLKIGQYKVTNYGLNRKSDQILKDFSLDVKSENSSLNIQSLQIDGLSLAKFFQYTETGETFDVSFDEPKLFDIKNVKLQLDQTPFLLSEMKITTDKKGDQKLVRNSVLNGFQFQTSSRNPYLYVLKQYGYDKINMFGNSSANYQYDQQEWHLKPFRLGAKDIGIVDIEATVKGPEKLSANNELAVIRDYKVVSVTAHFQDNGFIEHFAKFIGNEQNKTPDQIKQEWIEELQKPDENFPELSKQAGDALTDVINHPDHELIMEIKPDQPLSIMDLRSYDNNQMIDRLNIKVHSESKH